MMGEPKVMQAVRFLAPRRPFALQAVAVPEPGAGQVRLRVKACGICRTELHLRDGLLDLGRRDFTVGHEIAGIIDQVGPGVSSDRIGERVVVYYYDGCGRCSYCNEGQEQLCPDPAAQPGFTTDGGYAEYLVVRARNCVLVPDTVSLAEIAPMGCAGSTAVHAGRLAALRPGEWAVVYGVGGVGNALIQYAKACGARVVAIGLGDERLALARSLGSDETIDASAVPDVAGHVGSLTGEGADVVFELVGTSDTMRQSVSMLRRRGRIVLVGYTAQDLQVHPIELIVREAKLMGSVGSTLQDLHEVVDLVARGIITSFVGRSLPLERFAEGLEALETQTCLGRVVLEM